MDNESVTDAHNAVLSKLAKSTLSHEEVVDIYNGWHTYNEASDSDVYQGPRQLAEVLPAFLPDRNATILDIGAGQGCLGNELQKFGYTNIDGLEPAENFVKFMEELDYYKTLYTEGILEDKETSIKTGTYDCVVSSGSFARGHIPVAGLMEFARITRTGGVVGIIFRTRQLEIVPEYANLKETMEQMEKDGIWKLLKHEITEKFFEEDTGYLVIYEKL